MVSADLDKVFDFFSKPENLAAMTPGWLDFQILTPSPVPMREGGIIDYQIGLGPVPARWRSMITTYQPGRLFIDEQLDGPYSFWHHTHRFEEKSSGTLLTDEVRYQMPYGVLGRITHFLVIKAQLRKIFAHRHKFIARKFGERSSGSSRPEFSWYQPACILR